MNIGSGGERVYRDGVFMLTPTQAVALVMVAGRAQTERTRLRAVQKVNKCARETGRVYVYLGDPPERYCGMSAGVALHRKETIAFLERHSVPFVLHARSARRRRRSSHESSEQVFANDPGIIVDKTPDSPRARERARVRTLSLLSLLT